MDVGFIRMSCTALALSVFEECCAWSRSLAGVMRELDVAQLNTLRDKIATYHAGLAVVPEDLDQLKGVLGVVSTVR
jgi:hypothetical protein